MIRCLATLTLCIIITAAAAQEASPDSPPVIRPSILPDIPADMKWELVFSDEFDHIELDRSKWRMYGDEAPMERRDGYWTSDAAHIDTAAGHLVMRTYESDGRYYNACLHTADIFEPLYGYFEARIQLHCEEGHWPAFWLWTGAVDRIGKGGTDGAEIDIFEKFQTNRKVRHTIHWDGYGEAHQEAGVKSRHRRIMRGFHTFGLWWSPEFYRFYVDGEMVWETTAGGICQVPLHILISDEVGEHKRMKPIRKADLPDEWFVDHVRVYQIQEPVQK